VEKTVNDSRDRLPASEVQRVESAIAAVREVVKGEDVDGIRQATEGLQKLSHAMAEQLYKQTQSNAAHAAASHDTNNDDVKDGEVVDA
jgi:molecular chaperone DnaK